MTKRCILEIRDEVNVRITGLDAGIRRSLSQEFSYEDPKARFTPAVKLGRWDGKTAFFRINGDTYVNMLPQVLPRLDEEGWNVVLQDARDYRMDYDFEPVSADTYSDRKWPQGHVRENEPVVLRDYQVEMINRFLDEPQCIQEVATAAGKTIVTAALSERSPGRSIVIVPSKSLVVQTEEDYRILGLDVGVYFGDRKEFGHEHTICTWQSLNVLLKLGQDVVDAFLDDVACLIVDECHRAKAKVLREMLGGHLSRIPIRWGLTGTVPKEEDARMSLLAMLGETVARITPKELQDRGILARCHVDVLQFRDPGSWPSYDAEFEHLVTDPDRLDFIAKIIGGLRESGNTLVYVGRIATGKYLQERLGGEDAGASFVSGSMKTDERRKRFDAIRNHDDRIIIATYGAAGEGVNLPRIFNLVLIEPGRAFVRVIQSIGRGIRKAPDKDFIHIWDIASTCKYASRHLTERKRYYREMEYPFAVEKIEWRKP